MVIPVLFFIFIFTVSLHSREREQQTLKKSRPLFERVSIRPIKSFINENSKRKRKTLSPDNWYFKLAGSTSYYRMGSGVEQALQQMDDVFSGKEIKLSVINLDTTLTMKAHGDVKRAETNVLPSTELGFGYASGRHRFEFAVGFAGLVKLNTIDVDTTMTMHEDVAADINDSPMAKMGFVDQATGNGEYRLEVVLNEEMWILTPSLSYDYAFFERPWGHITAGGSLGLVIISMRQSLDFRAERTDIGGTGYSERVMEGSVRSTAMNDIGPQVRLHLGYKRPIFKKYDIDFRLGVSYGYVDINRKVDGSSTIFMGSDALPISFPLSAVDVDGKPLKTRETTRLELAGIFIQAGISF